ncbi:MAG: porin [Thiolinea sp.]
MFAVVGVLMLAMPVSGWAEAAIFGALNLEYGRIDEQGRHHYRFNDRGTRFGLKGAYFLEDRLVANYILEVAPAVADHGSAADETRQAWWGLQGEFGEVRLGRHLSPARVSVSPVELFDSQQADQNQVLEDERVYNRSLTYINRFNQFGYAVSVATNADDRLSVDVLINREAGPYYWAIAHVQGGDHRNTTRLAGVYRLEGGHQLGAAYEHVADEQGQGGHDAYLVNGAYRLGKTRFKAQFGWNNPEAVGKTETLLGLGVDYDVRDDLQLRFQYSLQRYRDHTAQDREHALTMGVNYRF